MAARLPTRRAVLLGLGGVAAGVAGTRKISQWCGWDRPPVSGGYAAAADDLASIHNANVAIRYYVPTTEKLVALTFDDGPAPRWTPMVLDALAEAGVPATFFMVGRNLARHADLVRGRMDGHEAGNHSWSHDDLATLDQRQIFEDLCRAHDLIGGLTGHAPTLLRPPYGHLGGSTVLAANRLGYEIALWSHAMREHHYAGNPQAQAEDIVTSARPGSIILAHDEGDDRRLNSIRALPAIVAGLQSRGYRFVTVSEMIAAATRIA